MLLMIFWSVGVILSGLYRFSDCFMAPSVLPVIREMALANSTFVASLFINCSPNRAWLTWYHFHLLLRGPVFLQVLGVIVVRNMLKKVSTANVFRKRAEAELALIMPKPSNVTDRREVIKELKNICLQQTLVASQLVLNY